MKFLLEAWITFKFVHIWLSMHEFLFSNIHNLDTNQPLLKWCTQDMTGCVHIKNLANDVASLK